MIHRNTKLGLLLSMALAVAGCHHNNVKNPIANLDSKQPDKVLFDRAMDAMKHGKYDVARITLQTLINTYPDSEYIARAKLAVGDSWYAEGNSASYQQAEVEYKDFITFFPNLPEAAEAQLKIANMHYNQMEKPDRDYTHAMRAEDEYRQLIQQFPENTVLVPQAKQRLREVQEVLAERQYRIGHFYFLRESYPAAIARLKTLIDTYPLYSQCDDALMMLGHANENEATLLKNSKMAEAAKIRVVNQFRGDAGKAYARIIERYPGSDRADEARARLKELGQPIPTPTPEAIAQYKAEEQTRSEMSRLHSVMSNFHKAPNDLVRAPHVGEPTLVDPQQTSASEIIRTATLAAAGVPNPGNGGKADIVAVNPGDTKSDPVPRSDAQPPTDAAPVGTAPATSSSGEAPAAAAPPPASNSGAGSEPGIGELTPNMVSQPSGQPNGAAAAPPTNNATPPQPSAPDSADAAGTSSSKTSSDTPAQAPAQVNEIKSGTDPSASAASASSSNDSSDSSSSKKKKKKGLKKIVPF